MIFKNLILVLATMLLFTSCAPRQTVVVVPQKRFYRTVVVRPVPVKTIVVVPEPHVLKPIIVVRRTVIVN